MIAWYLGIGLGLLGLGLGTVLMAIPHWLNVREAGYQMGYSNGFRHGQEIERATHGQRKQQGLGARLDRGDKP